MKLAISSLILIASLLGTAASAEVHYLSRDGVRAVDSQTGAVRWQALTGQQTFSVLAAGQRLWVGSRNGLYALDSETGALLWRRFPGETIYSPILHEGTLYAGSLKHGILALDPHSGELRWAQRLAGWVYTPAVAGGTLISGGNQQRLWGLEAGSGRILWTRDLDQELVAPAVSAGEAAIVMTFAGTVALVNSRGEVQWQQQDPTPSLYAVVRGERAVLAGWDGTVRIRDLAGGRLVTRAKLPGRIVRAPVLSRERILVLSEGAAAALVSVSGEGRIRTLSWPWSDDVPIYVNGDEFIVVPEAVTGAEVVRL